MTDWKARSLALEQELREIANALSHDVRAPLRAIDGFSRALADECSANISGRGKEYLGWIGEAAQGMARQMDTLVGLARLSTLELRIQPVDLGLLAQDVVSHLRTAFPGHPMQVELADGLTVDGDPTLLRTLLESLLTNAWAFTRGVPEPRVQIGSRGPLAASTSSSTERVFCVADNGIGFDPGQTQRLFLPFSRVHTPAQAAVGLGMGLCRARRAVGRHGGRIWAESSPGPGATFCFTLPGGG